MSDYMLKIEDDEAKVNHFSGCVPHILKFRMLEFADYIEDEIGRCSLVGMGRDAYGTARVENILGHICEGYIPYQQGGFSISEFFSAGFSSGSYFSDRERTFCERVYDEMIRDYLKDIQGVTEDELEEAFNNFIYNSLSESQQHEFEEYEYDNHSNEPTLLTFRCYLKHDGVHLVCAINYAGAPDYSSECEEVLTQVVLTPQTFLETSYEELLKIMTTIKKED